MRERLYLTNQNFAFRLEGGGDYLMVEPGQGEAGGGGDQPPERPAQPPEGQQPEGEQAEERREGNQRQQRQERPRPQPIEVEGVADRLLRGIFDTYNRKLDSRILDIEELKKTIDELDRRLREEGIGDEDRIRGQNAIEQLEGFVARTREQERAVRERLPVVQDLENLMEQLSGLEKEIQGEREIQRREPTLEEQERIKSLRGQIREAIKVLPLSQPHLIMDALRLIAKDEEMSDYFQNRIISIPDSFPESEYNSNIDFYTKSTLINFFSELQTIDQNRAKQLSAAAEAREYFHNIQLSLSQGNIEGFAKLAPLLTDSHFNAVTRHVGVSNVNRLYDEGFWSIGLSKKPVLNPLDFEKLEKWVRERFEGMAKRGQILYKKARFARPRQLDPWEIERALTLGLNLFTAKIRGPELIASAAVENTGGARQWGSYKYESAVRLVNPVRYLQYKFDQSPTRGTQWMGQKLREELKNANAKERLLKPHQLPKIGGIDRRLFESSAPLGKVGYEWGWRPYVGYFSALPLRISKGEYKEFNSVLEAFKSRFPRVDIQGLPAEILAQEGDDYIVNAGEYIDRWLNFFGNFEGRGLEKFYQPGENYETYVLRKLQPVVDQVDFYRGILLSQSIPDKIKEQLWEKTAKFLPLRFAYFLKEEKEKILQRHGMMDEAAWGNLEGKLVQLQELRVSKAEEVVMTLPEEGMERWQALAGLRQHNDILAWNDSLKDSGEEIELTPTERAVIQDFIALGEKEAPYGDGKSYSGLLARVNWPYAVFMEDAIFSVNYSKLGPEFSRRRIGDAAAYSQAGKELLDAMGSGNQPIEEAIKHFEAAEKALEAPLSAKDAQNNVYPFIKVLLLFRRKFGGWDRVPVGSGIRKLLKRNQSVAQEYLSHTAPADDVDDEYEITQVMARRGILRRGGKDSYGKEYDSLLEKMRKDLGATYVNLLLYWLKTFGPLIFLVLPYEFIKSLREAK